MKRNNKLIKKLKVRNKKNSLRKKMLGDNVFWGMQGDNPPVSPNTGDHPFVDMKGEHPHVKPLNNKNNKE
ncbi:hypothetical protein [uncultured Treponema sp.]|uniref:hypothetical protein n=1 Tax=uncultured Treponema sp. TaxID=162155 RepID=UPI0025EBFBAE|nr:hypothetical protein [uncultured Treponema sp.]